MKQRRIDRLHGRIMSVETKVRGDALAEDAAAGATTLVLGDAGDFDEDGGWLTINDQVVEYTEVDDDEGTITLATGLTAAADEGDAVHVWSTLYDEVVDYQEALVELDGEYDNPEPVVAEVAEGVGDLPEGDRGKAGESCTLKRVADDEWEVGGVGGRSRKSRSIRFEADDVYVVTADDIAAGTATFPLSHRPLDESVAAKWGGVSQEPTEYTVNYDARTITWPLVGVERAGDRLWVHYAYRKGLAGAVTVNIPYQSAGWKYLGIASADTTDRSAVAFDDSTWAIGRAAFGNPIPLPASTAKTIYGWPDPVTPWTLGTAIWVRRSFAGLSGTVTVKVRVDNQADVYWNGTFVANSGELTESADIVIPAALVSDTANLLAVRAYDVGVVSYLDIRVQSA